jgi:hypothetical protein
MTVKISKRMLVIIAGIIAAIIAAFVLGGCTNTNEDSAAEQKRKNYEQIQSQVGFPNEAVKNPLEAKNTAEKLRRDSNPNRLSYVYLLSMDGKVISHFVAKGKVSSTDSQLLPTQEVRDVCCTGEYRDQVLEAAGDDGTYGAREPGIFFFTTSGQLVTWSGDYIQSDRQLSIKTSISLVADAN